MDVSFHISVMTLVVILGNVEQIKANACDSIHAMDKCNGQGVDVKYGTACYKAPQKTLASISCQESYTFDVNNKFTCIQRDKTWSPAAKAVCSMIESTHTALIPTSLFTSKVSPSEESMLSTVLSSETPHLPTCTMVSQTNINELSSDVQTVSSIIKPSTVLSSQPHLSSSINSCSIPVTSDPAASQKVKDSDINAAYIVVPVVICVIALLLGVGIIWWRRRTPKPSALYERREPGSLITNQVYAANGIDRHCSLMNVRQSGVNEYAEIPLDIMNSDENVGDNYHTIDILPEDKADVKKSYGNFKLSETEFTDTNYSHIGLNNTQNNTHADNTYSHTQLENVPQKPEIAVSGDDTYNKLNTTTLPERKCQDTENSDTEYSHAHAGGQDPQKEADNYSHLNTNMRKPEESSGKPKQQFEDGMTNKNSNIRQLSAEDLPSNKSYEFAKDFDNLQNRSEAPEYAKVTKKKPAFDEAHSAVKSYETAAGTTHNYLILEPEQNPAPTAALFKVVEDVSEETDGMSEAETGHEYFTLEKQDM